MSTDEQSPDPRRDDEERRPGSLGEIERQANEAARKIAEARKPATRRAGSGGPGAPRES